MRSIVEALDAIVPGASPGRGKLARLAETAAKATPGDAITDALLGVLERHPDEGFGDFWVLVDAVEQRAGYEKRLLVSLDRKPSWLGVALLERLVEGDGRRDLETVLTRSRERLAADAAERARAAARDPVDDRSGVRVPSKPLDLGDALVTALGKRRTSRAVRALIASLGEKPAVRPGPCDIDTLLYFHKAGVELAFALDGGRLVGITAPYVADTPLGIVLPKGIALSWSRAEARRKLGTPTESSTSPAWDAFDLDDCGVTLAYAPRGERIVQVAYVWAEK